jgi:uncharacterized membrane protein
MKLSEQEKSQISARASQVEAKTGVQVLAVVTGKSDTYPEVPWKVFSLGVALTTLALTVGDAARAGGQSTPPLLWGTAVLGSGLAFALASIFLPPFARSFLGKERAKEETKQFAQSLFLERGLSRTPSRKAALLVVSQFERRTAVVSDTGILDCIPQAELERISAVMDAVLARGSTAATMAEGLAALERSLLQHGMVPAADSGDEIPEEFLETEGPQP